MKIAQYVEYLRKKEGWSIKELARRAGLSDTAIGHIEKGRRSMKLTTAIKLAGTFGITLDELAGRSLSQKEKHE